MKALPDIGDGEEYTLAPPAARFYSMEHDAKIVDWRSECFTAAGLSALQAHTLAVRRDVDRVVVENMLKAGRTPRQVLDYFLAP